MRWVSVMILAVLVLVVGVALWLRSFQLSDIVTFLEKHFLAVAIGSCLLILALILALILIPKWQAAHSGLTGQARFEAENAARQTLAQIVGGIVLIAGLFFTWAGLIITQSTAEENQKIARDGQITDRLTKAIALLGKQAPKELAVRLGGIYALEQIAQEREDYQG